MSDTLWEGSQKYLQHGVFMCRPANMRSSMWKINYRWDACSTFTIHNRKPILSELFLFLFKFIVYNKLSQVNCNHISNKGSHLVTNVIRRFGWNSRWRNVKMQIPQYNLTYPLPSCKQEFALNTTIFVRVTFAKLENEHNSKYELCRNRLLKPHLPFPSFTQGAISEAQEWFPTLAYLICNLLPSMIVAQF